MSRATVTDSYFCAVWWAPSHGISSCSLPLSRCALDCSILLPPTRRCDPPVEFNRIPCERHAPRGTCLRATSLGVCESRSCTAGYTWRFDAPCSCYYKLASISVANAGATVGGGQGGTTECHRVAGVPFFYMDKGEPSNLGPRCIG